MPSSPLRASSVTVAASQGSLSAPFYRVPNEIIFLVAELLEPRDLNSLIQTSRRFAILLDSRLYDLAVDFTTTDTGWGEITVLKWASIKGQISVVEKLMKRNADLYSVDGNKWSLLHNAVHFRHKAIAEMLLAAGFDHSLKTEDGDAAIHFASYNGDEDILQLIIDAGCDVSLAGMSQRTALHAAANNRRTAAVQLLLNAGADVSSVDDFGRIPLHHAFSPDVMRMLLDAGSNLVARTAEGLTALYLGCMAENAEIVNFLIEEYRKNRIDIEERDPSGRGALHSIAGSGNEQIVRTLLENGMDPMVRWNGSLPLRIASQSGHLPVVKLLIEKGSDVNATDDDGSTALFSAAIRGDAPLALFLLEHGASPAALVSTKKQTPLHGAALSENEIILEALIDHGAEMNPVDVNGWTPLHMAADSGHKPLVDILLRHDAEIRPDHDGWTPLYVAVREGYFPIVEQLVEEPAVTFDVEDIISGTALHLAVLSARADIISLLLSKGADPLQLDIYGRTCMDWAALHEPTFELMKPYCSSYQPIDKAVWAASLEKSISKLAKKIEEPPGPEHLELYRALGRCLIFTGQRSDAITSYYLHSLLGGSYFCDLCENVIQFELYACFSCPNVDLCSSCVDDYAEQEAQIRLCRRHRFAPIPLQGYPFDHMSEEWVNELNESRIEWLYRVANWPPP